MHKRPSISKFSYEILDYLIKSKVFYLSFSFEILFFSKKYETPIS